MRGSGRVRVLAVVLAAVLLGAACGKKSGNPFGIGASGLPTKVPTAIPTSVPSLPSGVPTAIPTVPTSLPIPTSLPTGSLSTGSAHVQVSGSVHGTFDLALASPAVFVPPPGGVALIFSDDKGDAFGFGGPSFNGTKKSSSILIVTLGIASSGGFFGTSTGGECTIHLTAAEANDVQGSVVCAKMPGQGGSVDLKASFSASS
jgi:hypothetical protein